MMAEQAFADGMFLRAEMLANSVVSNDNDYVNAQALIARIAFQNGRIEDVISILENLPENEEILFGLAAAYQANNMSDKAIETFRKIDTLHGKFALSTALIKNENFEEAHEILSSLDKQYPNDVSILFSLSCTERSLGLIEESVDTLKHLLHIDKGYAMAYINLIGVTTYNESLFDLSILETLSKSLAIDSVTEALLLNTLGKCYENIGKYEQSFDAYKKGNDIVRKAMPEDFAAAHDAVADRIIETYTEQLLNSFDSDKECPLIFIFGMPRSGSTLVEQILINHPDIDTDGETGNVQLEISEWLARIDSGEFENSCPDDMSSLGDKYLELRIGNKNSKFVIDKMPANFNYIGLMYMLFPNAKFIYTKRSKADTCFSGWTTMYSGGHPYSYTLEEMSHEYDTQDKIVKHWIDVMPPGSIHTIEYENLVTNFDAQLKSLCEYIGIEEVQNMREFHKLKRRVRTASVGQVTMPLYSSSIGRADKYGEALEAIQ